VCVCVCVCVCVRARVRARDSATCNARHMIVLTCVQRTQKCVCEYLPASVRVSICLRPCMCFSPTCVLKELINGSVCGGG
jgi:hypothetical protein